MGDKQDKQEVKHHVRQSVWMCARFALWSDTQLEVFRWLVSDAQYRCVYILHDRDTADSEDVGKEYHMDADIVKTYALGDPKPPHYHMIIRIPKKLSAETFSKRFGKYVNFQICGDPSDYAFYLTHQTFASKHKYQYNESDVCGDVAMYKDLIKTNFGDDVCATILQFTDAVRRANGDQQKAVALLCREGNAHVLRSVMSHGYFYANFCEGGGKDGADGA